MTFRSGLYFFLASLATFLAIMLGTLFLGAWFIGIFVVVCSLSLAAFIVASVYAMATGAPYVPSNERRMKEMLRLAAIKPGEKVIDLGSGDGRLVVAAARQGAQAEGWEIGFFLWLWSRLAIAAGGVGNRATTGLGSFWNVSLRDHDVIFVYLLPRHMARLEAKLRSELKPGARVISNAFIFPGWEPAATGGRSVRLYVNNVKDS